MSNDFTPQKDDTTIRIPVTFDYRGGRGANIKNKVTLTLVFIAVSIMLVILVCSNEEYILAKKLLLSIVILYAGLFCIRFFALQEFYYSDVYEKNKARNNILSTTDIWNIFNIDSFYPYICYYKNGYKGLFVRMERDTITGKSDDTVYQHYEALGDAYNLAHTLNMNIINIDYMDNVGKDPRLSELYDELDDVSNPAMHDMLLDIYDNLQEEMRINFSSFDIYVFMTREKEDTFIYNVQSVVSKMLGGNFITYKILDKNEIMGVCIALFNLENFSVTEACENALGDELNKGIVPIKVVHLNTGTEEKLNKTREEKRIEEEELLAQKYNKKGKENKKWK